MGVRRVSGLLFRGRQALTWRRFLPAALVLAVLLASCGLFDAVDTPPPPATAADGAVNTGAAPLLTPSLVSATLAPALPSVAEVVAQVRPAVVSIATIGTRANYFGTRPRVGGGTGFIVTEEGHVVTNYHVVEGSERIRVATDDGRTLEAELVGHDPRTDLAVLKIAEDGPFPTVTFADPDAIAVGDWVIAIGNALGLPGGPTVTVGVVGALERTLRVGNSYFGDLIQTDAAINDGNSGGPLVSMRGEVVGVNTIVVSSAQGIGFSVGSFTSVPVVRSIINSGRVVWPWLGVSVEDVSATLALEMDLPSRGGVVLAYIWPDSPADEASLRQGDVVVAMNGSPVGDVRDLQRLLREQFTVDQQVLVELFRDGKRLEAPVTLGEMPR